MGNCTCTEKFKCDSCIKMENCKACNNGALVGTSDCCSAKIEHGDICSACKEPCDIYTCPDCGR